MWFLSGMVMLYVPFPSLSQEERLSGLARIDWREVRTVPASGGWLQQGADGPIWLNDDAVSASTGMPVEPVDRRSAARIAAAFARAPVARVEAVGRDQWTVAGGFDRYRPLWKVTLDRPDGLVLYVASTTGMVVLDTNRTERFWNWLGSVPHWLYPTVLRQDQPLWRQVVLWTSGVAIVGAVSGMWIGVLRVRLRRRFKGGRVSPYRGWQWWHHVMGLAGGTLLLAWIVSGWLSVDPCRWFVSAGLDDAARAAYQKAGPPPAIDWTKLAATPQAADARRMQLLWTDGVPLLRLSSPGYETVLNARNLAPAALDRRRLVDAARRLMPGARIVDVEVLTSPDSYWYEAKGSVELPVLRIRFTDPARTWVYISPRTGEVLRDVNERRRVYRWLFDGLHRWDFALFTQWRPLWDLWMWLGLTVGAIVSLSGTVIGIRRLRGGRPMRGAR